MIECGLLSLAQLRTATAVKLKTNSLMSKSRQTITESGASASCSESVKKVLDTERRFIDDLMTLQNELLHTLGKRMGPARTQNGRRDLSVKDSGGRGTDK